MQQSCTRHETYLKCDVVLELGYEVSHSGPQQVTPMQHVGQLYAHNNNTDRHSYIHTDIQDSPGSVWRILKWAVWSLHMLARQYSILLLRHRKLNTLKYLSMASPVNTWGRIGLGWSG